MSARGKGQWSDERRQIGRRQNYKRAPSVGISNWRTLNACILRLIETTGDNLIREVSRFE